MSAVNEQSGSNVVISAASFHVGACSRTRETAAIREPVRLLMRDLKAARAGSEDAKDLASEKFGELAQADYAEDEALRMLELGVLAAVRKNRKADAYRAAFPKGLAAIIALRGKEQETAVKASMKEVRTRFPELAERHSDLPGLAATATQAEGDWLEAETAASNAFNAERLVRLALVRQLQKNEGALIALFPGQKARVRSFFPAARRPKKADGEGAGNPA